MIRKYFSRFRFALKGLSTALISDFGFRSQIYLGVLVAFLLGAFLLPLAQTEILFVSVAYALVLITELQNSALEAALDKLHPERHDAIGKSKDLAAGAVLLAGLVLLLVILTIVFDRFLT